MYKHIMCIEYYIRLLCVFFFLLLEVQDVRVMNFNLDCSCSIINVRIENMHIC